MKRSYLQGMEVRGCFGFLDMGKEQERVGNFFLARILGTRVLGGSVMRGYKTSTISY